MVIILPKKKGGDMFTVISVNQPRRQLFQQADHLLWKCLCSLSVFHQWYVWWGLSALHSLVTVPGGVSYTVVNHTFHLPFHLTYLSVLPRLALPSLFLLQRRVTEFLHPYYCNDFVVKTCYVFIIELRHGGFSRTDIHSEMYACQQVLQTRSNVTSQGCN